VELYRGVLPWLEEKQIPFVFTSSYLEASATHHHHHHPKRSREATVLTERCWQGEPMPYGSIKRLGEMWVQQMELGRSVRLWNVWGFQPYGLRSHVMNDWVHSCLRNGRITPITDGLERRQFLHVNDTAKGLIALMDGFSASPEVWPNPPMPPSMHHPRTIHDAVVYIDLTAQRSFGWRQVTDMSTGEWITLRLLAQNVLAVAKERGLACTISWPDAPAKKRTQPEPDMKTPFHQRWGAEVNLRQGIAELFQMHAETDGASHIGGGGMCGVNQKC